MELARRAVALDPGYGPAQVALAARLAANGDITGARRTIDAAGDLAVIDDGFAVLARIRWAQGDVSGAIEAAERQITGRQIAAEPGGGPPEQAAIDEAHEILGLAYLEKGALDRAAPHLLAARAAGSQKARQAVERADPALRKALMRARHTRTR
jgi:hypothetical protein